MRELNLLPKGNFHVPKLYDFIMKDAKVFIVMEYFEYDLNKLISDHLHELSRNNILKIIYQMLNCMRFLHSVGIIHRDIKPQNVFITKDYDVKIGDFGSARSLPKKLFGAGSCNSKRIRDLVLKRKLENVIETQNIDVFLK